MYDCVKWEHLHVNIWILEIGMVMNVFHKANVLICDH